MESIPNQLQWPQSLQLLMHKKSWMIAGTAQHCTLEMHELPNMLGCLNPEYPHGSIATKLSRLCNLWWHWRSCNQQQWTHPWGGYHAIRSWCCWGYRGLESSSADPIPQWHAATGRYCLPGTLWITTMISPWRWWSDPPLGHPVCHLPPSNKPLALVVPSSHHKSQTLMFLS